MSTTVLKAAFLHYLQGRGIAVGSDDGGSVSHLTDRMLDAFTEGATARRYPEEFLSLDLPVEEVNAALLQLVCRPELLTTVLVRVEPQLRREVLFDMTGALPDSQAPGEIFQLLGHFERFVRLLHTAMRLTDAESSLHDSLGSAAA